jgi:hypothetical protein
MIVPSKGEFHQIIGSNKNLNEIAYGKSRSFFVANMRLNARYEITVSMNQRSIAPELSTKELPAKATCQDLVEMLGAEAVAYPTVTWYLRAAKFPA